MTDFNLEVLPRREGVCADGKTELDVLVRMQAPDAPPEGASGRSHCLNLAFVIDRSGSMEGRPLEEAKRCVLSMVEALRTDDRAGLVAYDNNVDLLQPSMPVGDAGSLRHLVQTIRSGGTTDLHGGWLRGAGTLADTLGEQQLARVVLLSDGMANRGETDVSTIAAHCGELAVAGVTTSTYGLGHSFNEDLMVVMARNGHGNHYYGRTADDLIGPFREEFSLMENLCGRNVRLSIRTRIGVEVELLNDYSQTGPETWALPDLAYGGEAWAIARLRISEDVQRRADAEGMLSLIDLSASFAALDGSRVELPGCKVRLPVMNRVDLMRLNESALVASRVMELEAARYQLQMGEAARAHDWYEVEQLLQRAESTVGENPWVREVLTGLRRVSRDRDGVMLRKEARYSAARMTGRLADKYEAEYNCLTPDIECSKNPYLRRKREQGRQEFEDER